MQLPDLAKTLREMYQNALPKEMVTNIHLFGIKYHKEIQSVGIKPLLEEAGINKAYHTEIRKGMRLAKYVNLKPMK